MDFARTYPTAQLRQGGAGGGVADAVTAACRDAGLTPARVVATVPGFIDRDFDTVLHTANIPELNGIRLGTELASNLAYRSAWSATSCCNCWAKALPAR